MHTNFSLPKIFTYIGAALIFFGITFFININWSLLNSASRIIVTLGAAIAAYAVGLLLYLNKKENLASSGFFLICALLLPAGLFITAYELGYNVATIEFSIAINMICLLVFLISFFNYSLRIFLFFSIIFATFLFLNSVEFVLERANVVFTDIYEYSFMVIGLAYILLGRYLDNKEMPSLVGVLYFFGILSLLSASYCLAGFNYFSDSDTMWKIITGALIFLTFVFSVLLRSKSFLYLGAFFLAIYIIDISSILADYFGGRGWPLVLIIVGFLFILASYGILRLRKQITNK